MAVAELVVVEALEVPGGAAEQAAQGVVPKAGAPAPVEADVVQLAEASVAIADVGVEEVCSKEGWHAPSPGRSRSRNLASALQRARL
jgi:glycine/D-amino acid oxidase-like deaminating enzyme